MTGASDVTTAERAIACLDAALVRMLEEDGEYTPAIHDFGTLTGIYKRSTRYDPRGFNPLFDEEWYVTHNTDVAHAIRSGYFQSGFHHFVYHGMSEGRWPAPEMHDAATAAAIQLPFRDQIDEAAYRAKFETVDRFLGCFPTIDALSYYNSYGRRLGEDPDDAAAADGLGEASNFRAIQEAFDPDWYARTYLQDEALAGFRKDPFTHYLIAGMPAGHSPREDFSEAFYRAFYPEIQTAIERGDIPSGFYHYLAAGRAERRLPAYERKAVLDARIPGVTRPVLLERIRDIEMRMRPRKVTVGEELAPRVWILLPTINPDITFGGYKAVMELIRRLHQRGRRVTVVCTEDGNASRAYFLFRESSEVLRKVFAEIDVIEFAEGLELRVGPRDTVVAYSLWDLYAADAIRKVATGIRVVLLAQEFEPIFYDNNAARALVEQAYNLPHVALINSGFLRDYLRKHEVGVFAPGRAGRHGVDHLVFEHKINILPRQTAAQMRARSERVLVTYARPEGHAARNMFEILVLALRRVCAEGLFGPEWHFVGLGSLSDLPPVDLGGGHMLTLHPKMTEEEYIRYVTTMDIGVSLMYAPHPSVVPFEFATTGAMVVTNTYENRSAEQLAAVCANIIAGAPTIEGVAEALREAIDRVPDAETRVARSFQPARTHWDDIFADPLLDFVLPLDTARAADTPAGPRAAENRLPRAPRFVRN
ncbi:hypothetical protein [Rhizosaccharibacter radicis]|uniref:Glycosyl transferase family 1 domain-containing protein n=1 Tax=Rhizosaccharibacter radicis TaxID=2782605 RepID=A0ABT1W140_9PROT|nr:hypothetical protein [Acetobacteraceae bacterium KSS12]